MTLFVAFGITISPLNGHQQTVHPDWQKIFSIKTLIHQEKGDLRDICIFENDRFGKILALDGVIQMTEKDECIYHEMMAHVPLLAHPNAKSVLLIGGSNGGLLREIVRHETLEKIVQVEIDSSLRELSIKHLPTISNGVFDNPRVIRVVQDAAKYVKETPEKFDVILCDFDCPSKNMFTAEFYANCKKILHPEGIFVNQNKVSFMKKNELRKSTADRKCHFKNVTFFTAPLPFCIDEFMAFGWASDKKHKASEQILEKKRSKIKGEMQYYTPAIHRASFALPQYILNPSD